MAAASPSPPKPVRRTPRSGSITSIDACRTWVPVTTAISRDLCRPARFSPSRPGGCETALPLRVAVGEGGLVIARDTQRAGRVCGRLPSLSSIRLRFCRACARDACRRRQVGTPPHRLAHSARTSRREGKGHEIRDNLLPSGPLQMSQMGGERSFTRTTVIAVELASRHQDGMCGSNNAEIPMLRFNVEKEGGCIAVGRKSKAGRCPGGTRAVHQ